MTNEEAIRELQRVDDFVNGVGRPEVLGTPEILSSALELAIKALETGEVYMTGKDYNLYLEGYKEGIKDYKEAIKSVRQAGFNDGYEQGLLEGQKSRKRKQ